MVAQSGEAGLGRNPIPYKTQECRGSQKSAENNLWPPSSLGFPDSSVGKEFACNTGDPGLIPGSGRSTGEEIGYPLQYSWASLGVQLVKNSPAMQETWV